MTTLESYIDAVLERAARTRDDVIEEAISRNNFARLLRGESPTPLNRIAVLMLVPSEGRRWFYPHPH
jgi:hypothetical protein